MILANSDMFNSVYEAQYISINVLILNLHS